MVTQLTIKIEESDKEIISKAGNLVGIGHSTFCKMVALREARKLLKENGEGSPTSNLQENPMEESKEIS